MTPYLIAGLCLALSALLVRFLDGWIGPGRAKFHDLTRPAEFVHQVERTVNNEMAINHYEIRRDALGYGAVRPVRDSDA